MKRTLLFCLLFISWSCFASPVIDDYLESLIDEEDEMSVRFSPCINSISSRICVINSRDAVIESKNDACCNELNSKIDIIINVLSGSAIEVFVSIIEQIEIDISIVASVSEILVSEIEILSSTVEILIDKLSFIEGLESIVDRIEVELATCCEQLNSKSDSISSKLDTCCAQLNSKADVISSKEDVIISREVVIQSLIEACCSNSRDLVLESIIEKIDREIQTCCEQLNSKADSITSREIVIESKLDTCCAQLNSKADVISSKEDVIISREVVIESKLDTCCAQLNSKSDSISSKLDTCCAQLNSKADVISSKEDVIISREVVIQSLLETCCAQLNSKADVISSKEDVINSKLDVLLACDTTPITGPTTISSPGTYCLSNNFSLAAGNGITITASNVKLNLNKRTITGTGGSNGVVTNSGTNNIIIENGIITTMTQNGMLIQSGNTTVENCDFIGNSTGLAISGGKDNYINDCLALDSTSAGFSLASSSSCNIITNCKAIDTLSTTDNAYGFISSGGTSNVFDSCYADCIQTTTGSTTLGQFTAVGFLLTATETGSKIINCKADNVTAPATALSIPYGIRVQEANLGTITQFSQASHTATLQESDWSNDTKYLAVTGSATGNANVRIFGFDGNSFPALAANVHNAQGNAIKWDPVDNQFLALAAAAAGGIQLKVLQFTGTAINDFASASPAVGTTATNCDWSPDGKFVAVTCSTAASQLQIYSFNGFALTRVATFDHGAQLNDVSWARNNTNLVVGGVAGTGGFTARVLSFDGVSTITLNASVNTGATVNASRFHPTSKWIVTGQNTGGGDEIQVYAFSGAALTLTASFAHGATVNGVAWSQLGGNLVIGGAVTGGVAIRYFSFDGTTLTQTDTENPTVTVNGISFSKNSNYIAATNAIVAGAECEAYRVEKSGSTGCLVQNSIVSNTSGATIGVGISSYSLLNLAYNNTSFNNNYNYRIVNNYYTGGAFGTPSSIQNIGVPPN